MSVTVKSNVNEVIADLHGKIPRILEALALQAEGNAVDEVTKLVYDTPESPNYVRTGDLRKSISHATDSDSAYVGTNIEYALYVETGTRYKGARPFLKNSVANHVDDYKEIIEKGLKN